MVTYARGSGDSLPSHIPGALLSSQQQSQKGCAFRSGLDIKLLLGGCLASGILPAYRLPGKTGSNA